MKRHLFWTPLLLLLTSALAAVAAPAPAPVPVRGDREDFFMISSIDAARGRIVLKRPTEVTLLMQVNGQTVYRDEQDKPLRLADLRTGDTAYIAYRQNAAAPIALRVRLGAMTVQELQRRYR
ncbi:MAG TPA: hypothetical protein VGG20_06750 [Thermoanaerobaculia bacterium]|jgi:hypothetical protein